MDTATTLSLMLGAIGTGLGVFNTVRNVLRDRVRLRFELLEVDNFKNGPVVLRGRVAAPSRVKVSRSLILRVGNAGREPVAVVAAHFLMDGKRETVQSDPKRRRIERGAFAGIRLATWTNQVDAGAISGLSVELDTGRRIRVPRELYAAPKGQRAAARQNRRRFGVSLG